MQKMRAGEGADRKGIGFGARAPHLDYLGRHTAISHLYESGLWREMPYLKENMGMLPPFVIVAGDRRRVSAAPGILGLKECVFLDELAASKSGKPAFEGRVRMAVGTYEREGIGMPLAIVESQMGVSAAQINLREIFAHTGFGGYAGRGAAGIGGAYAIRVGSAGGINLADRSAVRMRIGDLVNADFTLGDAGAISQGLGHLNRCGPGQAERIENGWVRLGHGLMAFGGRGRRYFYAENSPELVRAISATAMEMGFASHVGGNFTKDSLYLEADERQMAALRMDCGVLCTEMEMLALNELAGRFGRLGKELRVGMVAAIVGTVPGGSFAKKGAEAEAAAGAEENALAVAAGALWSMFSNGIAGVRASSKGP